MLYNRSRDQRDKALSPEDLVLSFERQLDLSELDPEERRAMERQMFGIGS